MINEKQINAIIQARCGSTRFPRKVFADINGHPLIWHVINRLKVTETINKIIVATTVNSLDDEIEKWCIENNIYCFRGSETDVLNRYYEASKSFPSDIIVRITADDPFKEPAIIDEVVEKLINGKYDLVTNNFPPTFPEGLDCEAFWFKVLEKVEMEATSSFDREHVTQYIYHHAGIFRIGNVVSECNLSKLRWTIDNPEDYEMVKQIYANRKKDSNSILLMDEILKILEENPEIAESNSGVKRSAMYQ